MRSLCLLAAAFSYAAAGPAAFAEIVALSLAAPAPYSVTQRQFDASNATDRGFADLEVAGACADDLAEATAEYAITPLDNAYGKKHDWRSVEFQAASGEFALKTRATSGGWYRLEMRFTRDGKTIAEGAVEPIGVGEVFIVAGQSYAANSNDERLKVAGPGKTVSVFDPAKGVWRIADDPQPTPDKSDGGSIWPAFGDLLSKELQVPIGMVNVAYGGTSTARWAPGDELHRGLCEVGKKLGRFRAVLWQQGESDVIEKTSTDDYVKNLVAIRDAAAKAWGQSPEDSPVWLLAKSTLHPTVYNDPEGENRIRRAIDLLAEKPGFRHGPDTDKLDGENRGGPESRRHFSPIGQRRAAQMWCDVVVESLPRPEGPREPSPGS